MLFQSTAFKANQKGMFGFKNFSNSFISYNVDFCFRLKVREFLMLIQVQFQLLYKRVAILGRKTKFSARNSTNSIEVVRKLPDNTKRTTLRQSCIASRCMHLFCLAQFSSTTMAFQSLFIAQKHLLSSHDFQPKRTWKLLSLLRFLTREALLRKLQNKHQTFLSVNHYTADSMYLLYLVLKSVKEFKDHSSDLKRLKAMNNRAVNEKSAQ